jgi:hypothetical protein
MRYTRADGREVKSPHIFDRIGAGCFQREPMRLEIVATCGMQGRHSPNRTEAVDALIVTCGM